jgi:hypothetical protein
VREILSDADRVAPLAAMALAAIGREYPNHVSHLLQSDGDALSPSRLHPAFFGSFDWHSAVHGHWCVSRLARLYPHGDFAQEGRAALGRSLAREPLAAELAYLKAEGRDGFERPYGLAWLLQLASELREWESEEASQWREALLPLERLAVRRLGEWLSTLPWPVRAGEHSQSAFALGLALDWAQTAGDRELEALILSRSEAFYGADTNAPIAYEPSGNDFLSPVLGEADLMRRVRAGADYAAWLHRFLPDLECEAAGRWLTPVTSPNPADGKLAHLDGLNSSRAWMLEGIAEALPAADPHLRVLAHAAASHRQAALAGATSGHYAGSHWLASFAVYLLTGRGLRA